MQLKTPRDTTATTTTKLARELEQEREKNAQLRRTVENLGASLIETERVLDRAQDTIGRLQETKDRQAKKLGKRTDDMADAFHRLNYAAEQLQKAEANHRGLLKAHLELKEALKGRNVGAQKAKIRLCLHSPAKKKISA